ncbi:hypothetical protein [Virgisporangium aurantiacum]|uniref:hypothetical protein n=1 Tax=Virgisporangium aurantiacum TaxID=175570 RepID=UPI001950BFE3|nr:hypothetical protein [Virgisporangium aurantiacum]
MRADYPQLARVAEEIAADDDLPGSPGKDVIGRVIRVGGPASREDTVTVALVLARAVGEEPEAAVQAQVRGLWLAAQTEPDPPEPPVRLGRPVAACDPFALEVHPAIDVVGHQRPGGRLPVYVVRDHDSQLRRAADLAMAGSSASVTVVGGSSTGKTRACWELAQYLEQEQPGRWWVWHPFDPTRPDAVLAGLDEVGAHTIVWLNEAQLYLAPADVGVGERVAARLRTLLQDQRRRPVLVLATLWPEYWNELTRRSDAGEPDPYAQARNLLTGTRVGVPDGFAPAEVSGLAGAGVDPRLREAAAHAEGGRITQYLAGAPELEDRYRTAPPAAKAIIHVAIDARRLGHPVAIPHALLEQAAPGYINDQDWDSEGEDWLEVALAYIACPCNGVRGPLTRIRPRPGEPSPTGGQPGYRLADYLEQTGHTERAGIYPPDSLWRAFTTTVTDLKLLRHLANQAQKRGRFQHAVWLYTQAADCGDPGALWALADLRERAGDAAGAEVQYQQAADCGHTGALWSRATLRRQSGDTAGAEELYRRAADLGDIYALGDLAELREEAGDTAGAAVLYRTFAERGTTADLRVLAKILSEGGHIAGVETLFRQAADLGDTYALVRLAELRAQAGDAAGAEALAVQAADRGDTGALWHLAWRRESAGDAAGAEALAMQAADLGNTYALVRLAELRAQAGDAAGAKALAVQAADRGDTGALWHLAWRRESAGDAAGAEALAVQAADRGDTDALRRLAERRERAGDAASAEALYRQAADLGDTFALQDRARLRESAGDVASAEVLFRQAADLGNIYVLGDLARLRDKAGDPAGAEALALQAADLGHKRALPDLARLREKDGDAVGAEVLYRLAANRGWIDVLPDLVRLRDKAGDSMGAKRIWRFGLTGSGEVTTELVFGS